MMNATCQEIQRVIETIGPKGLPDAMPVHEHLRECDSCRAMLAAGIALDEAFGEPGEHDVDDATVRSLMTRIEEIEAQPEPEAEPTEVPWWKRRHVLALAASIAGVTVIGGLFAGQRLVGFSYMVGDEATQGIPGDRSGKNDGSPTLVFAPPEKKEGGRSSHANTSGMDAGLVDDSNSTNGAWAGNAMPQSTRMRPQATPAAGMLASRPDPNRQAKPSGHTPGYNGPYPRATGTPVPARIKRDGYWANAERTEERPYPADPEAAKRVAFFRDYGTNPTIATKNEAISTFAVDVDSGSYSIARSYLQRNVLPPMEAIRVEEFINAFDYAYDAPESGPFSVSVEAFPSPNRHGYHVLHVGLKGREIPTENRKAANLVFVIDVSGSMNQENRLGLVKQSLEMLVDQLDERDSVGIVVYGTNARTVLEPMHADDANKDTILRAIYGLHSEGSTNAAAGIQLGYQMAQRNFRKHQVNRIVLCSDGVANQGITDADGILTAIGAAARKGITISTVGFGMNTYNDVLMEQLADKGNGNYAYVDRLEEAHRIFVQELTGTLQVIAKDVKIQLEFDPKRVERYRLLGFENRSLTTRQFDDDKVDAGEIGAGHTVTAIYEVKLTDQASAHTALGQLRLRYKEPQGSRSSKIERTLPGWIVKDSYQASSPPTKLSMVSAGLAEKLRGSYWARNLSYAQLLQLWEQIPPPLRGRKDVLELRDLIVRAQSLDHRPDRFTGYVAIENMDFDHVPVLR